MSRDEQESVHVVNDRVRCLWVPLCELNLLLPNMVVAEIGSYRVPTKCPGTPEWLAGMIKWRERDIPVVTIEALYGLEVSTNPVFSRLMIVNSVRADSAVDFYAVVTAGLPGLMQFGSDTASRADTSDINGVQCEIQVGSERAVIPDLDYIQKRLESALGTAA